MWRSVVVILWLMVVVVWTVVMPVNGVDDAAEKDLSDLCSVEETCRSCMFVNPACNWCSDLQFIDKHGRKNRCDTKSKLLQRGCRNVEGFQNYLLEIKEEKVRDELDQKSAVLITPQTLKLQLRPNEPYKFKLTVREAANYPVDLYYLMDLSHSMKDDKENIASLGNSLAKRLAEITSNVRLGFGSFVDKKAMPYVSILPDKLVEPCQGCVAPYGFKNALPLTTDTSKFGEEVFKAPISGNLDGPEGGFDALMQAMVCKEEIGWRDHARHLLIFSTDEHSHFAGDGLLGGIVVPNDGMCHMENNSYTYSTKHDYPSLAQLKQKLEEKKINLIFAVTKNRLETYKKMSEVLEGSVVGELESDSTNIVKLIEDNYNKIASKLQIQAEGKNGLEVKFKSKCFGDTLTETTKCDGLNVGAEVEFEVELTARKCTKQNETLSMKIYRQGIGQNLVINASVKCDCDCEKSRVENSAMCSSNGTYLCGVCSCNEYSYGKNCECNYSSDEELQDRDASCRNANDTVVCSGNGQCRCGECICDFLNFQSVRKHRYHGEFCQCNDFGCNYAPDNKLICGGAERGDCNCGECECKQGWTGSACHCSTDIEACRSRNGKLCNGKGQCKCGRCVCDGDLKYGGATCEDCPSCPPLCEDKKHCVQCKAFKSGPLNDRDCELNCPDVRVVETLVYTETSRKCQFPDDDGGIFFFIYDYDQSGNTDVQVQRSKDYVKSSLVWWISGGVIASIVILGILALIIWRLVTTYRDRKEYEAYLEMCKHSKMSAMNPLYKAPESKFKNPVYRGNTVFDS